MFALGSLPPNLRNRLSHLQQHHCHTILTTSPATDPQLQILQGCLGGSVGKEPACDTGDPGSIPGLGRSAGEGTGYPLQCYWASLVAQMEKNPPAMRETWVPSLGWEGSLEKGQAIHSSILAWRIPWTVHGVAKSQTWLNDFHFHF